MSTTITIPTELEARIAERAAAQGKDVEQFALEALSKALETSSLRELFANVREEMAPKEEVDTKIEAAVEEVRKLRLSPKPRALKFADSSIIRPFVLSGKDTVGQDRAV